MRFPSQQNSCFAFLITGLSVLLYVNGINLDLGASLPTSEIQGSGSEDDSLLDISNTTSIDNGYGYKFRSKSGDKDEASVTLAQNRADGEQSTYGACGLPTIANGLIKGYGINRSGSRYDVAYSCSDGFADTGRGVLRCDGLHWQRPPDTVCRRTCPHLTADALTTSIDPPIRLDPLGNSRLYSSPGLFFSSTRWRFRCGPDLLQKFDNNQNLLECGDDGQWKLLDSQFMHVPGEVVEDVSDLCEALNEPCRRLPLKPGVTIRYKMVRDDSPWLSAGDEAFVACMQPNYVLRSSKRLSNGLFRCLPNGRWSSEDDIASLNCVSNGCPRPFSGPQLKLVYEEQDTRSHRQIFADDSGTIIRHGVRIFYRCDDPDHYYLVGDTEYICNSNDNWSPPYWPKCEKKRKCSAMDFPIDGYYNSNPATEGFEPGHTLTFGCIDGFRLEGRADLKCLESGEWNFRPPTCVRNEWSTKRFIAVTSVACLLGVLLVVLMGFFLQRQLLLRKALGTARRHRLLDSGGSEPRLRFASINSNGVGGGRGHHHQHPQLLTAAGRTGPAAFDSDPDRLALIAFADGVQVPLPSYEEAVSQAINERRCHPPPFDAISTLSGYCSRAVRRLPSLSSLRSTRDGSVGNGAPNSPRVHACSGGGSNYQRPRLREQWSSTSGSNVSSHSHGQQNRHIGSNETVAVSDVSTNITLETVSTGGQSQTASACAYAGSLSSILSSSAGGLPATSVPVVALSVCSASSMASSVGSGSTSTGAGASSAMGGSQSEGLPLLESQEELDVNQEDYEGYQNDQQQQSVNNSDEICSQKSLDA